MIWDIITCIFFEKKPFLICIGFIEWITCAIKRFVKWIMGLILSFLPCWMVPDSPKCNDDDEEEDDACKIIIEKGKEAIDDAMDAYKEEEPCADDDEARDYVLECYEKHLKKQKGGLAVCEPIKR